MLKIRRPLGRLIFNMGIAIPGKTVFLIETDPRYFISLYQKLTKKTRNSLEATNVKIGGIWDRTGISVTYANRISAGYQHSSTSLTIDKMNLNPIY